MISGHEEARLIFGAIRASRGARPRARPVLRPRRRQPRGHGRRRRRIACGRRACRSASARLTADLVHSRPALEGATAARLRAHLVDVLGAGRRSRSRRSSRSSRSGAAARSRASRTWSRPAATRTRRLAEPAHDHQRRVPRRSTRRSWRRPRPSASGSTGSTRAASTSSSPVRCSSPPRWSCSGSTQLTICEWALREGIVLDAVGRHDPDDWSDDPHAIRGDVGRSGSPGAASGPKRTPARSRSSRSSCSTRPQALHGLDAARPRAARVRRARSTTSASTSSSSGHHKHGAYLVRNGQLRGFAPDEIEMLAAIVRWHRRGEPRVSRRVPAARCRRDRRACARSPRILRVADGLDRSRSQIVVRHRRDESRRRWCSCARPHTDDAELEIWGARRKRELLEKVFDRELELTTHPSMG